MSKSLAVLRQAFAERQCATGKPCPRADEVWEATKADKGILSVRRRREIVSHLAVCSRCSVAWALACWMLDVTTELPKVRRSRHFGVPLGYLLVRWPRLLPVWLRRTMYDHVHYCRHCGMLLKGLLARQRRRQGKPAPPTEREGVRRALKRAKTWRTP